jgi:hypothetical protein
MRALAWNPETAMHESAVLDELNSDLERMDVEVACAGCWKTCPASTRFPRASAHRQP